MEAGYANAATWTGSRKPNLFIIGSMKSGTTLLWKLLGSHPSIYMCSPKEPSYFVEPDQLSVLQPFLWKQGYWRSEERYLKLFQSDKNELFFGEASVYYTHLPHATGVAERLNRFNPQARLIYIMRDPIERTISHYWHRVVYNDEHRTMLQAIAEDSQYCDVSYYAMQLSPYFDRFKADHIKVLTLEELVEDRDEVLNSIFNWLNLDISVAIPSFTIENATPETVRQSKKLGVIVRNMLEKYDYLNDFMRHVPRPVRTYYTAHLSGRQVNRRDVDIEAVVRRLQPLQRWQTAELSGLIGRGFPEWKTLYSDI